MASKQDRTLALTVGYHEGGDDALSHGDLALLHRVSELTCRGNQGFAEVRAIYEAEPRIRAPRVITSYTDNGPIEIELEI